MSKGLDVGTNSLIAAYIEDDKPIFKIQRDAFYIISPKTPISRNTIKNSFVNRGVDFIEDGEDIIVVGADAINIAVERNDTTKRPLVKGVISPKDKGSLPMLKLMLGKLLGDGHGSEKLCYSVPGAPVNDDFDIVYHKEILNRFFSTIGYDSYSINEAYAIALSELIDDDLTGVCISYGAGMTNTCVVHNGDPIVEFSLTVGGDYIDKSVSLALDLPQSVVQLEKEAGVDLINPEGKLMETVSIYYENVIKNTLDNIAYELKNKEKQIPSFRGDVKLVVAGGLVNASGFVDKVKDNIINIDFPFNIGDVLMPENPNIAVANGCLLASQL